MKNDRRGQKLLAEEFRGEFVEVEYDFVEKMGIEIEGGQGKCRRCESFFDATLFGLPGQKAYCPFCLTLGRVTSGEPLYFFASEKLAAKNLTVDYPHPLTEKQAELSAWVEKRSIGSGQSLVWAVTGAGKTEMMFAAIAQALNRGGTVGWAAPRVDVCLEIAPRLNQSFSGVSQVVLYGKSDERYMGEALVVGTTHQLLRFTEHFDLLIIDEVDAFPFVNTPYLKHGAKLCVNPSGHTIYLTATPTSEMVKQVAQKKLVASVLPARFHGHPLPVPELYFVSNWQKRCLKKIPPKLLQKLSTGLWLIFCPSIVWLEQFVPIVTAVFPEKRVVGVYASDPNRHEKIMGLRAGAYDLVVTTTILERGVTIPNAQVLVMGSNRPIFTKEVLVQIAGRVGRKLENPTGQVIFVHDGKTLAMKKAVRVIKLLNKISDERGLLHAMQ